MIKSWSMAIKKPENFLTSSKKEYILSFSQGVYIPAGATMKRRIEPIHDTEDVEAVKYSMNSTAKTPKLATQLKNKSNKLWGKLT